MAEAHLRFSSHGFSRQGFSSQGFPSEVHWLRHPCGFSLRLSPAAFECSFTPPRTRQHAKPKSDVGGLRPRGCRSLPLKTALAPPQCSGDADIPLPPRRAVVTLGTCVGLHYSGHGDPNYLSMEDGRGGAHFLPVRGASPARLPA